MRHVAALTLLAIAAVPLGAGASTGLARATLLADIGRADLIFEGTAMVIHPVYPQPFGMLPGRTLYELAVVRMWKGAPDSLRIRFDPGSTSGPFRFQSGETYLVFARRGTGYYLGDMLMSSGTALLSESTEMLEVLKSLGAPASAPELDHTVVSELLADLESSDETLRSSAMGKLQGLDREPERVGRHFQIMFRSRNEKSRSIALRALCSWWASTSDSMYQADLIQRGLQDSSPLVRLHAVLALGSVSTDSPAALEILQRAADDREAQVRSVALSRLATGSFESSLVYPLLLESLNDEDSGVRAAAARGLGQLRQKAAEALPSLLAGLSDTSGWVRGSCLSAISTISTNEDQVVALLNQGCTDPDPIVREMALSSFAHGDRGETPAAVQAHLRALTDERAWNRYCAVRFFLFLASGCRPSEFIRTPEVYEALTRVTADPDHRVRRMAAQTLETLGQSDY